MRLRYDIKFETIVHIEDGEVTKRRFNVLVGNMKVVRNAKSLSEAIQKFDREALRGDTE